MTITLGELKEFSREVASADISGPTAERDILRWINAAYRKVWLVEEWDHREAETLINMPPEEALTGIGVTQGSTTITGAPGTFLQKYVDDKWAMVLDTEANRNLRLASVSPLGDSAELTSLWVRATGTVTGVARQDSFALPETSDKVQRVQDADTYIHLSMMRPREIDHRRTILASGSTPRFYAIRRDRLEVWPASSQEYQTLAISYLRSTPAQFTSASLDTDAIDWPDKMRDLLEAAIIVIASERQPDPPIPYDRALIAYQQALSGHKSQNNDQDDMSGPMQLGIESSLDRTQDIHDLTSYRGPLGYVP